MSIRSLFSLFIFLSSAFYFCFSFTLPFFSNGIPGSGFLPGIIGIILVLLTGYNFIKEQKYDGEEETFDKDHLIDMLKIIIFTFMYVLFFNILGALLATFIFTIASLITLNKAKWIQNMIISSVVTIIVFIMFDYLLNTHLPLGIFENFI